MKNDITLTLEDMYLKLSLTKKKKKKKIISCLNSIRFPQCNINSFCHSGWTNKTLHVNQDTIYET